VSDGKQNPRQNVRNELTDTAADNIINISKSSQKVNILSKNSGGQVPDAVQTPKLYVQDELANTTYKENS